MRPIKFRAWDNDAQEWWPHEFYINNGRFIACINNEFTQADIPERFTICQFTGLKDKNGKEIYFGDILRFADKWEWYRGQYAINMMAADPEELKKLQAEYDAEPYEERVVESIEDYEWLLSSEIQSYWEVVGNKFEPPELLEEK